MTDEEIAELVAENERLRALTASEDDGAPAPVIIEAPEPIPVADQVAIIEAQAEATATVIEAEADAQVAVIEAEAKADEPTTDGDGASLLDPHPESDHWYFRNRKGK